VGRKGLRENGEEQEKQLQHRWRCGGECIKTFCVIEAETKLLSVLPVCDVAACASCNITS
jgi:hypothetical protein